MPDADAVAFERGGRRVLLKWHKLRRAPHHPPFSLDNLRVGVALGASLEVDIRLLADNAWVCLHDGTLDRETDGSGPVRAIDTEAAQRLRIAGAVHPPPLLTELTATLADAAPGTCLQFDLKEDLDDITDAGAAAFAEAVAPFARRCLLSGEDWQAVQRLGTGVPGLRLGYDPCRDIEKRTFARPADIADFAVEALETAPKASAFYIHHGLVTAGLALGVNPIAALKKNGAVVDVWTLDPTTPDAERILTEIVAAGADQITTNDPPGLARLWRERAWEATPHTLTPGAS